MSNNKAGHKSSPERIPQSKKLGTSTKIKSFVKCTLTFEFLLVYADNKWVFFPKYILDWRYIVNTAPTTLALIIVE
jgi:hypothetical protein